MSTNIAEYDRRIAEANEVRQDRELRIARATIAVLDRELRTRPVWRIALDRLRGIVRGRK